MQTLTTALSILLASAAAMLAISPEAKDWAAEILEHLTHFLCVELRARARAQTAARETWERVYREQRGAGNWTPAAAVPPANRHAAVSFLRYRRVRGRRFMGVI